MARPEFDWRFVRRHTFVPVLSMLFAAAILTVAIWLHARQELLHSQFSVNQNALHEDYDELVYRRRLVDRYFRRYQSFNELGFVGKESRLDWIETLRAATNDLTLPRISYAIEPQLQAVAPIQSIATDGNAQIHVSRLQLEMGLVHEMDLLRFIDELQKKAPGLISVDHCELDWQGERTTEVTVGTNILASCSILIFSVITSDVDNPGVAS